MTRIDAPKVPPDIRNVIVKSLGAALADAWRRRQQQRNENEPEDRRSSGKRSSSDELERG